VQNQLIVKVFDDEHLVVCCLIMHLTVLMIVLSCSICYDSAFSCQHVLMNTVFCICLYDSFDS